ncbi:helicase HerA-like domain-containing protein [Marinobacter sp.]|uniref:helicase HerA-like domain-containing protein n=1 Tax=Marinobacter sp. TaxID=50741 RepID=UPI0035C6BD89
MHKILVGKGDQPVHLLGPFGNRHGLIAGATGTGKTVTMMVLAEGFSRMGVPVFIADVKGDVAGLSQPGEASDRLFQRAAELGVQGYGNEASPVVFWDLYGSLGHPVRTTISEMGPNLLARVLELNETQTGVLEVVFRLADDQGLLLLDLEDLRALLGLVTETRKAISKAYGLVSPQSVAAIQRALLALEREGGDRMFGEPALDLNDFMTTDLSGRGIINVFAANQLILKPRLYSSFLLWLLSELFENLPEVGDPEKPGLVFFFDEAHLLFDDAPPILVKRVEQVVRLIRSKGVGVYFCSQFPDDLPGEVLGQLGNRFQHALRAFTPRDQKAVRTAAETFAANPRLDVAQVISELGVGEALVSTLQDKGVPLPVERTRIAPPRCRMGAITDEERAAVRSRSPVGARYDTPVNRESAHEILARRAEQAVEAAESQAPSAPATAEAPESSALSELLWGKGRRQGLVEAMAKSAARSVGSQLGRQILRGLLGGILGGSRRR